MGLSRSLDSIGEEGLSLAMMLRSMRNPRLPHARNDGHNVAAAIKKCRPDIRIVMSPAARFQRKPAIWSMLSYLDGCDRTTRADSYTTLATGLDVRRLVWDPPPHEAWDCSRRTPAPKFFMTLV